MIKKGEKMSDYKIFSKRLKELLAEKGMTQRALAEKAGLTEVAVSRYISAQRLPGAFAIVKIAAALDCSIDYLLGVERGNDD